MGSTVGTVTVDNETDYTWTICIESKKDTLKGHDTYKQDFVTYVWSSYKKPDLKLKQGKHAVDYCSDKPELSSSFNTKDKTCFIIKMSKDDNSIILCLCKDGKETTVSTHPTKG
ncbi:hypothetical protein HF521_020114 [Silurus meridionalis]|uniref:Uncharacterized protein n=1 Tax=Silurus meridionalis TaxID=175797 RepID=A0A8T0BNB4_SILME|nr:hypothetical protein HF521_020114 [Silurus meridionalis]